jgi:uncharacterized protein YegP (UPF0339 family)
MVDPLTWTQTNKGKLTIYAGSAAGYDFEIMQSADRDWRLRMWQVRRANRRVLFWDKEGYTLEQAQWTANQLLAKYIP